jgi:uncharacterized membrane protein
MRYLSIDVLRGTAILLMIQVHFVDNLSPRTEGSAWLYDLSAGLGLLPAPLFTFVAGLSYCLWVRKQESLGRRDEDITKITVRRGLFLFGTGIAFNVLVWLPEDTFNWDILTLLGTSLLVLAFARHLPPGILVLLAAVILILSPPLRATTDYADYWIDQSYEADFTLQDVLRGFFVNAYFPVFPWLFFPLVGFSIGDIAYPRPGPHVRHAESSEHVVSRESTQGPHVQSVHSRVGSGESTQGPHVRAEYSTDGRVNG